MVGSGHTSGGRSKSIICIILKPHIDDKKTTCKLNSTLKDGGIVTYFFNISTLKQIIEGRFEKNIF